MGEAIKLREAAARCFRLARSIGSEADADALMRLGRDLERRASEVEGSSGSERPRAND